MFGSKKTTTSNSQVETVIGRETQIQGTVNATGAIRIDGVIEGELVSASVVVVGESGSIKALLKARSATIAGTVVGNVEVAEKLELLPTAQLYGDIKAGALIVGEGAVFKGACEMKNETVVLAPNFLQEE